MIENIEVIYKNGVLRPLKPLDLPEGKTFNIDVRDVSEMNEENPTNADKIEAFDEWMANLNPNTPSLTDEQISRESIYEEQLNRQR